MPYRSTLPAKDIIALYLAGKSQSEVGAHFGICQATVSKLLRRHDVATRTGGRLVSDEQRDEIVRLYLEDTLTNRQILQTVGLPSAGDSMIYSTLRGRGVARKSPQTSARGKRLPPGSVNVTSDGYVVEKVSPDWPFLEKMFGHGDGTWIPQHRKVMAETLGRPLLRTESVHHKNGDRSDNRPDNLQLRVGSHGTGVAYCCATCGSTKIRPLDLG